MTTKVNDIKTLWSAKQARQVDRFNQVKAALMMYRGDHQWAYDSTGRPSKRSMPLNLRSWSTVNLYQQIQRTVVANITKGNLIGQVYPLNASPEAREAAKATQALLDYLVKHSGYTEALAESVHWALLTGDAILKVVWDPDLNTRVIDGKTTREGGVRIVAPCPQSLIVDDSALTLHDSPWIIHEVIYSKEVVKLKWPDLGFEPVEDASSSAYTTSQLTQAGLTKRQYADTKTGVRVLEYWERPSKKNPSGVYAIVINDAFAEEPKPWPTPRLPFVHWRAEIDPGQFHGRSFMWDLIPIQKSIDTAFSSILDYISKLPRPALLSPKGSIVKGGIEQHTGREIIEYDARLGKPAQLPPQQLEAWVQGFIKDMSTMMDIVSGVGASTQGRAPYAQATGRAMAFLIEMDQTKMGPMARRLGDAVINTSKLMLDIQKQFQTEPIMVRMQNLDGHYDYKEFQRSDIEYGEIDIDVGAIVSSSQAVLQDTVQSWVHIGIMDPSEARKILSLGPRSWEDLDPYAQDRAWAKMNIGKMLEGEQPVIKDYMAWAVHYEVTANFMKGKQYLTDTYPVIQQQFESYLSYLQQQAQANMAVQEAPPEGAGNPATADQGGGPGMQPAGQPGMIPGMPSMQGQVLNTPAGGNPQEEQALLNRIGG